MRQAAYVGVTGGTSPKFRNEARRLSDAAGRTMPAADDLDESRMTDYLRTAQRMFENAARPKT